MNSGIQQPGFFRRYSERLSPCLSSTEYPQLAKGSSLFRNTNTAKQKGISRLSPIQTRSRHDTRKPAPAYARQSLPDTCAVAAHPALRYHYALNWIRIGRLPYGVQALAAYRFPMSRMLTRYRRHAHQRRVGYDSVPRPIRTRHIPDARIMRLRFYTDACSFVRHCLRGPAYVSYRRSASYFTAGEWLRPFEPRKAQRQGKQ